MNDLEFLDDLRVELLDVVERHNHPRRGFPVRSRLRHRRFIACAALAAMSCAAVGVIVPRAFETGPARTITPANRNPTSNVDPVASPVLGGMGPYRMPLRRVTLNRAVAAAKFPVPIPNAPAANPRNLSTVSIPRPLAERGTEVVLSYRTSGILIYISMESSAWNHPARLLNLLVTKKGLPGRDIIQLPSGPALATPTHIQAVVDGALVDIISTREISFDDLQAVAASLDVPN
jgi:hypothetical protein